MKYLLLFIISVLATGCYSTVSWSSLTHTYDRETLILTPTGGTLSHTPVYIFNNYNRNSDWLYYSHIHNTWVSYPVYKTTYHQIYNRPVNLTPRTTGLTGRTGNKTRPKTQKRTPTMNTDREDGKEGSKMRSRGSGEKKTRSLPPSF